MKVVVDKNRRKRYLKIDNYNIEIEWLLGFLLNTNYLKVKPKTMYQKRKRSVIKDFIIYLITKKNIKKLNPFSIEKEYIDEYIRMKGYKEGYAREVRCMLHSFLKRSLFLKKQK